MMLSRRKVLAVILERVAEQGGSGAFVGGREREGDGRQKAEECHDDQSPAALAPGRDENRHGDRLGEPGDANGNDERLVVPGLGRSADV